MRGNEVSMAIRVDSTKRFIRGAVMVLALFVTLSGCRGGEVEKESYPGKTGGRRSGAMAEGPKGPGGRPPQPAAAVAVTAVHLGEIATYYSATASLDPNKEADVPARVNGIVKAPQVEEGDRVVEGQILIEIEDAEYRHRVTQAQVELDQQRLNLERSQKMQAQGLVSAEEADAALSKMQAARATWELANLELSYTKVRSPFSGRVIAREVDEGRMVSNGTVLFTLADLSRLLARVHVPAREFRSIQTDQPVDLVVDSTGDHLVGRILLVSPVVDPKAGTIKVTIEIRDFPASTRPGDFAEVSIVTDRHEDVVIVPRIAVLTEKLERVAYVADGDKARRRVVEIGFEDDSSVEILSGLEPGERVVIQGQRSLSDGQKISILEKLELGDAAETPGT
jgi:RND family efflux transporter MFP subunit